MQPDEPSGYRIDPEQDAPPPSHATAPAYGQPVPYSQPGPYTSPPGYIPPSYGPAPSNESPTYGAQPAYGSLPSYGQPSYGQPSYGQPSYGQPSYGQPTGWYGAPPGPWNAPPRSSRWPYGPDRPGMATAAAVLGFVTAGLTLIAGIVFLIKELTGDHDVPTVVLLLGIPCAAAQILGGARLLRRRSRNVLLVAALAAVAVLVAALVAAAVDLSKDDFEGFLIFFFPALPLPIVTAAFAWQRTVSSWIAAALAPLDGADPYGG